MTRRRLPAAFPFRHVQAPTGRVGSTSKLLSIVINVDGLTDPLLAACLGGTGVRTVNFFDDCFETYFWAYDNNGLKLLELRFYAAPAAS